MFTTEDIEKISNVYGSDKVTLSSGDYFIKCSSPDFSYNELIGKKLADIFGIKCADYKLIIINGAHYILSKDLNTEKTTYISACDYGVKNCTLYNIWNILEPFIGNFPRVMIDIIKMYIYDLLFMNSDRNIENWGILHSNDKSELVIIDNEFMFDIFSVPLISSKYSKKNDEYFDTERKIVKAKIKELQSYFNQSSSEFIQLFKNMYDKVSPEVLLQIMEEVEQENDIIIYDKAYIIESYRDNYELIGNILKGYSYGR